ncbi:MAG: hypothetical protein KZQ94_01230 [Candidatus Thiodiazotropha sp. (ex Troendleina suluensis)]|nr:hypothetical protein [Candidatus Thiodiazotropha sp. (ex Troendleina suluensis)]
MNTVQGYYTHAELAQASYANLESGIPRIPALTDPDVGFSPTQARDFAENWRVLDQYDGRVEETYTDEFGQEHTFLNPTGLSVTAFEHVETGEQVVAIRGTEPSDINDLVTDVIDIGTIGTTEKQAQYAALSAKVRNWLDNGTLQSGFDVTGHSLGGFLATNLSLEYFSDVTHTYLYNAPGLGGVINGDVFQAIFNALLPGTPLGIPHNPSISHLVATDDVVSLVGLPISTPVVLTVEPQSAFGAHSMVAATDALAICNLLASIDPSVDLTNDLKPILEAASNQSNETLESIVYALSDLLINPIDVPIGERESLYQAIQILETELFVDRTAANPQHHHWRVAA